MHIGSPTTWFSNQILFKLTLYSVYWYCFVNQLLRTHGICSLELLEWSITFGKTVTGDLEIRLCIPIWPGNKIPSFYLKSPVSPDQTKRYMKMPIIIFCTKRSIQNKSVPQKKKNQARILHLSLLTFTTVNLSEKTNFLTRHMCFLS